MNEVSQNSIFFSCLMRVGPENHIGIAAPPRRAGADIFAKYPLEDLSLTISPHHGEEERGAPPSGVF